MAQLLVTRDWPLSARTCLKHTLTVHLFIALQRFRVVLLSSDRAYLHACLLSYLWLQGFSVTIPHKEAAHKAAASRDPVADQIGACNTLIRQPDGSGFKGYNTDWIAAISAIERVLAAGSSKAAAATSSSSTVEGQPSPLQVGRVNLIGYLQR
jgi:3-dehydroquinate dehydratase/shikimate dehydrogenase